MNVRIESGTFAADAENFDHWKLVEGTGKRVFPGDRIEFKEPFASPPQIHLGITEFDILNDRNARLRVHVADCSTTGFSIHVWTWCDSKVWSVEVDWLAFGE